MSKILLVEDDKSLREIYGVRLMAEGYEIVSAGDGEEALAIAIKERPSLIISDVMMPKISGFDMLDILRSTSETKDVKIIMMTALSSEDQRARGETLGADRYLVKSQVGIEDVVRTVHDVLDDAPTPSPTAPTFPPVSSNPVSLPPLTDPRPDNQAQSVPPVQFEQTPIPQPQLNTPIQPESTQPLATISDTSQLTVPPMTISPQPTVAQPPAPTQSLSVDSVIGQSPSTTTPPSAMDVPPQPSPPLMNPAITPEHTDSVPSSITAETSTQPLPQPIAPFSTPAPASLGENITEPLNDINASSQNDIANQMQDALNDPANPQQNTPTQ